MASKLTLDAVDMGKVYEFKPLTKKVAFVCHCGWKLPVGLVVEATNLHLAHDFRVEFKCPDCGTCFGMLTEGLYAI